ncbi:25194_t:CDS:1, partial [Gigaspora rosea]
EASNLNDDYPNQLEVECTKFQDKETEIRDLEKVAETLLAVFKLAETQI